MNRSLPPEIERVKNWCLKEKRFNDANFIIDIKRLMENNERVNSVQAKRLARILALYALDKDLEKSIKERLS